MTKSKPLHDDAQLAMALLRLAAVKAWEKIDLNDIVKASKVPLSKIKVRFTAPHDLMPLIAREIDKEAFASFGKITGSAHDRLFETLMARFDVMQKHRLALLNIARAARHDRGLACALTRASLDSLNRIMDVCRLTYPPRPILATGIAVVYGWAFYAWGKDTSRDMAKTMATLDRGLRVAGKVAEFISKKI